MNTDTKALTSRDAREGPRLAEYGFWIFLAIAVGRINQLVPGLGSLPLAKLAVIIAAGAFLVERKSTLPIPTLSAEGRALLKNGIGMACLAALLAPISIWPGASLHFVLFYLPPLIVNVAIACAMRRSWKSMRGTLLTLLLCGFVLGGAAAAHHTHGRAVDASTDYDPNDLAYVLVTVVPLGFAFFNLSKSRAWKVFYGVITATIVAALLLTESRGGLLGFLASLVLMVFLPMRVAASAAADRHARSLRASLVVALVIAGAGLAVWSQLPQSAQERYLTLLHLNHDYNTDLSDKTGREDVWLRGLRAFVARPIGYGPQTYEMVDFRFGGRFKAPHNSYLQALVELGPLGLWFLLRTYFLTLRALQRTRSSMLAREGPSPEQVERAVLARALQYGMIANMVSGFFLSDAYSMLPWTMFGLTAALSASLVERAEPSSPPAEVPRLPEQPEDLGQVPPDPSRPRSSLRSARHARPT